MRFAMVEQDQRFIRVLIVDDEPEVRDAYREILAENDVTREIAAFRELRTKLFNKAPGDAPAVRAAARSAFAMVTIASAEPTSALAASSV